MNKAFLILFALYLVACSPILFMKAMKTKEEENMKRTGTICKKCNKKHKKHKHKKENNKNSIELYGKGKEKNNKKIDLDIDFGEGFYSEKKKDVKSKKTVKKLTKKTEKKRSSDMLGIDVIGVVSLACGLITLMIIASGLVGVSRWQKNKVELEHNFNTFVSSTNEKIEDILSLLKEINDEQNEYQKQNDKRLESIFNIATKEDMHGALKIYGKQESGVSSQMGKNVI